MTQLYPQTIVNDVLERSSIVDLVSSYLPLKRAGRNYKACCPFHPEKTPSFIVSADKQIFHCFGCGAGGNALTFVMQYEKVRFREALEALASRCGIPLPEPEKSEYQKSQDNLGKQLLSAYEKACRFYHEVLLNDPGAAAARAYLKKRGISRETAQHFQLGYAPAGWDNLIRHLKTQNLGLSLIEKSGLTAAKEGGGFYDRFRERLIFPIADIKNRVIAFGARVLDNSLPKYLNSPESQIYTKGRHLFGLSISRDSIREKGCAIVVEGYLDMITPFEAGIKNIVASLGTALTAEQVRLLRRYTDNVVMLYDADAAGQMATLRALTLLIKEDVDVKIAKLPHGEDPDSFARQRGREEFEKMIAAAQPIFDYTLDHLLSKYDASTSIGKDKVVREILPTVKKFKNHALRAEYVRRTSQKLGLDEKALWNDLSALKEEKNGDAQDERENSAVEHYRLREIPVTERMLVKLMLEEIHLVDELRRIIDPSDFTQEPLRKIVQFIFNFFSETHVLKPNILMNYLGDEEAIHIISELSTLEIHASSNKAEFIADCVERLKRDKILHQLKTLLSEIQSAQESKDNEALNRLILEYNVLIKQRSPLHGKARS